MRWSFFSPRHGSQRSRYKASVAAFTLIEILVVLMIIGIISTVAVLTMGDGGRRDKLTEEATRLQAVLKLAQEEAQLYGVEMGVSVAVKDYQFVTFDRDRWTPIADDKAYKKHKLDEEFQLALKIEGFKLGKQNGLLPGADIRDGKVVVREDDEEENEEDDNRDGSEDEKKTDQAAREDSKDNEKDDGKSSEGVDARAPLGGDKKTTDGRSRKPHLPQIFLLSSGEVNPFTLTVGSSNEPALFYRLRGKFDGSIVLEGPIEGDLIADMDKPWQGEAKLDNEGNVIDDTVATDDDNNDADDDEVKRE